MITEYEYTTEFCACTLTLTTLEYMHKEILYYDWDVLRDWWWLHALFALQSIEV
jgi:hypothetical protein